MSTSALGPSPARLIGRLLPLLYKRRESQRVAVCCPSPEPGTHWRTEDVQPSFCGGRDEGTDTFRGRRGFPYQGLLPSSPRRRSSRNTCLVQTRAVCAGRQKSSQTTLLMPTAPGPTQQKKARNPLLGVVCLLTTGVLISVRLV